MMDWWRSLSDYLKVEFETDAHEINDKDALIPITFTVTNTARPPAVDQPEVTRVRPIARTCSGPPFGRGQGSSCAASVPRSGAWARTTWSPGQRSAV